MDNPFESRTIIWSENTIKSLLVTFARSSISSRVRNCEIVLYVKRAWIFHVSEARAVTLICSSSDLDFKYNNKK